MNSLTAAFNSFLAESIRRPSISDIVALFRQEMIASAMKDRSIDRKSRRQKLVGRTKKGQGATAGKLAAKQLLAAICASSSG